MYIEDYGVWLRLKRRSSPMEITNITSFKQIPDIMVSEVYSCAIHYKNIIKWSYHDERLVKNSSRIIFVPDLVPAPYWSLKLFLKRTYPDMFSNEGGS